MDASDSNALRPRERDSHDLSEQFARYSVVDNMLLSLAGIPSLPGEAPVALPSIFNPNPVPSPTSRLDDHDDDDDPYVVRANPYADHRTDIIAHGHSRAAQSLQDIDETSSRYTAYHATGRINAPPAPSSRRPSLQQDRNPFVNTYSLAPPVDADDADSEMIFRSKSSKSHAKKSSVGSHTGSIGPPPRFQVPDRSSSFDYSAPDHGLRTTPKRAPRPPPIQSPDEIEAGYAADAAPTPTVPGGPRRNDVLSSAQQSPSKSRRNSIKSARTLKKGKSHSQFQYMDNSQGDIRDQARQFVNATNTIRNAQSNSNLASVASSGAPSPAIGGQRGKAMPSPATQAPAQKQGFFRRVFGGVSKQQHREDDSAQQASTRPSSPERPKTQPPQPRSSGTFSRSRPPTQDPHNRPDNAGYPLRKSSSSFFRRRKRSTDHNFDSVPPVPSLQHLYQPQDMLQANTLPSLRGSADYSLQNVMAPYLTGPNQAQEIIVKSPASNAGSRFAALDGFRPHYQDPFAAAARDQIKAEQAKRATQQHSNVFDGTVRPSNRRRRLSNGSSENGFDYLHDANDQQFQGSGNNKSTEAQPAIALEGKVAAQMPTRPAPIPDATSKPPARVNIITAEAGLAVNDDKTLLSPISDHSLRSPKSHQSLSSSHTSRVFEDGLDEEFILSQNAALHKRNAKTPKNNRVWLQPSESEENLNGKAVAAAALLPKKDNRHLDSASAASVAAESATSGYESASSVPALKIDSHKDDEELVIEDENAPTEMERTIAQQIFEGEETLISKASAAAWLGRMDVKNVRSRQAYMELYNWTGVSLLAAFRELCARLILRAESQQLDRVIDAFSDRWCECNMNHGFKGKDVVHTLVFAILMLNTDLHITDSDQRMTRSQFVKNTLPTLRSLAVDPSANDETIKPNRKQERGNIPWDTPTTPLSPAFGSGISSERPSMDIVGNRNRLSRLQVPRTDQDGSSDSGAGDTCTLLVNSPFEGSMKNWEGQVEIILKEFYNSIRGDMLPLHGNECASEEASRSQQPSTLSVVSSAIRRTPSVLSKAPSENASFRGRAADLRAGGRFASKSRNRPRMYPSSTFTFGSSRTSLDDQSLWSPAASTFTKHSFGKTQTSMSVESLGGFHGHVGANPAIGFANAVSRKIIREENGVERLVSASDSGDLEGRAVPFFENEDLELHGPPWAKEGILDHLSWMGANGKRAKERRPVQCFAVVAKGHMRLFSFAHGNSSSKGALRHLRQHKSKAHGAGGPVGGGNWADSAEELGSFILRQTWASTDNKTKGKDKPTWYMHLPTGEIHAFIVNSIELADEWTWTVNYWSARLSRQPLIGGVSSEEYGWSDNLLANIRPDSSSATNTTTPPATASSRPASSMSRVSFDQSAIPGGNRTARLPGDRTVLHEWRPPAFSTLSSQLMEVDQKNALEDYLASLDDEFSKHSELRPLMSSAFSTRHPNAAKALTNWTRKANYLTGENVKYKTYIGALERASTKKNEIEAEKDATIAAQEAADVENAPADAISA